MARYARDQQAVVTIEIIDGDGVPRALEVILDTGFTGYLDVAFRVHRTAGNCPS